MDQHTGVRRLLLGIGISAGLVAGCAKPPDTQLEATRAAMSEAKAAGAEVYAPNELRVAMDSLAAAETEIEKQNGKFALFRNYKEPERKLTVVQTLSQEAKAAAAQNMELARVEAESLYVQVGAMVDSTRALMAQAPRDKEGKKIMEAITTDLDQIAASQVEVRAAIDAKDYRRAKQLAQGSQQRVDNIRREIQSAIDRKMGRAPAETMEKAPSDTM